MKNKWISLILSVCVVFSIIVVGKHISSSFSSKGELSGLTEQMEETEQGNKESEMEEQLPNSSDPDSNQNDSNPNPNSNQSSEKPQDGPNKTEKENLDNSLLSWYFRRNSDHKIPETNSKYLEYLKGNGYYAHNTEEKVVYLTFDNGYENGYTPKFLDVLKQNEVKAAFFVTGSYVRRNPDLVKRMAMEGHIIGNHTVNHPSMPKITDEKIREEIKVVEEEVEALTGMKTTYLRPPAGEFSQRTLVLTKEMGYKTIFWSMAYKDWVVDEQPGKEYAYQHVLDNVHNGAIILLHTVSESNAEALDDILKSLQAEGYRFATLDELP
jgi:peptidoglycan-N-acetylmuramic acid deacetylase